MTTEEATSTTAAQPGQAAAPHGGLAARSRVASAVWALAAGAVGSLPVAWVLGAVPWRTPTLLIESMFRGFAACALDGGALTPWLMVCRRAGVPLGMYQLDGGLSYPLAGLFVRLGLDALPAWKASVWLLLVPGFVALFWLGVRLTGSRVAAGVLVVVFAVSGTLTARTWNWYWNTVAASMLPLVFAAAFVVFDRARQRRARLLLWPGVGLFAGVVAIGIEWSYAGLFAAAVGAAVPLLVATQRGWTARARVAVALAGTAALLGTVAVVQWRLSVVGVDEQFGGSLQRARENSIDLAAFLLPDTAMSMSGRALNAVGLDALVVRGFSEGSQLWVAPYLGVVALGAFALLLVARRIRPPANERCPERYLTLLVLVFVGSLLMSMGPRLDLAGVRWPDAHLPSPFAPLWGITPLRWIRYPWTWHHLTFVALLLALTALTPAVARRTSGWSPLAYLLAAVVLFEFSAPVMVGAALRPAPSVSTAPGWARVTTADPEVANFEATAIPELHRRLQQVDGIVTFLPWGNTWVVPHLGPEAGISVRNVGIDRNVRQVQQAAPIHKDELRNPTAATIRRMLDLGWTDAVVLLDHGPAGRGVVLAARDEERPGALRWQRRAADMQRRLVDWGYCADRYSWFAVVTRCDASRGV